MKCDHCNDTGKTHHGARCGECLGEKRVEYTQIVSNHTPGKWVREVSGKHLDIVGKGAMYEDYHICRLEHFYTESLDRPKDEANANMIAASPEMYEIIKLIEHSPDAVNMPGFSVLLKVAIAKAEGKQ